MNCDILQYGATPETAALQTPAIQSAIDDCAAQGGGTVRIPPGVFRTGTLELRSGITLELSAGATLLGPGSMAEYRKLPFAWDLYPYTVPLIFAEHAENVRIAGEGTIDFQGRAFAHKDQIETGTPRTLPPDLLADCHYAMPPRGERPNRLVWFQQCRGVEITGVTFRDSPTWTLVFDRCGQLNLHDFRVANDLRIPNNDGIHCCGCKHVRIAHFDFEGGDDGVALTSISAPEGVNEDVEIADSRFHTASAALRIGFQAGKVQHVRVHDCVIRDSNRAIAIFAGEGGWVRDVTIKRVHAETRIYAGPWWGKGEPLVLCAVGKGACIEGLKLVNCQFRAENRVLMLAKDGGWMKKMWLDKLHFIFRTGKAAEYFGGEYDFSPHGKIPVPAKKCGLLWLWVRGNVSFRSCEAPVDYEPQGGYEAGGVCPPLPSMEALRNKRKNDSC